MFEAVEKELADWPKPLWLDDSFPFYFMDIGEDTEKLDVPSQAAVECAKETAAYEQPVRQNARTFERRHVR